MNDYRTKLKHITTFVFDYDGVLTDGKVIFTDDGQLLRNGNVKDGYAIQLAIKLGYRVAVISGAETKGMLHRCILLNIDEHYLGVEIKKNVFQDFLNKHNLQKEEVVFMGDDIPDYEVMKLSGIACCPVDAAKDIREIADFISSYPGGHGCVRDIIEQVLRAQGKWMTKDSFSW
jgi:3-deoxy-D-manno-octulosonate 8-phosphate phosphatase (KDO 8-P phosphatase)